MSDLTPRKVDPPLLHLTPADVLSLERIVPLWLRGGCDVVLHLPGEPKTVKPQEWKEPR